MLGAGGGGAGEAHAVEAVACEEQAGATGELVLDATDQGAAAELVLGGGPLPLHDLLEERPGEDRVEAYANALLEVHSDTEHGFVFPQRKVFNKHEAERNWERVFAMYRRQLG